MNDIQSIIDRQIGIYCRPSYDNVLRRLLVSEKESFYGLQSSEPSGGFDHDPPIFACRFAETSGYEHILALANEDGRVAIQDTSKINSSSVLEGFQCHNNAVFDLAWKPKHMSFVTVSGDHTACLWDAAEGAPKRVLTFSHHTRSVKTAVFRPTDAQVFATGARDGHVLIWDTRAGTVPSSVLCKPDNCLLNCHSSGAPRTPASHSKRPRIENQRAISITGLAFQDDQTLISCGECDGNIKVWDLRKSYNIYKREPLPKHSIPYCGSSTKNGYTNLIVDDARMRLYASCMDNVIYCFNISTYNTLPEQRYIGHENSTFYIKTSLSPDCNYLVSGSSDKNAYIWNVKYSDPVVKLTGHWAEVTCATWCRSGDMKLVTCSDDARHKIWRIGDEFVSEEDERSLKGRAEVVPRADLANRPLPPWGALDKTPNSLKRKRTTTPSSYSIKRLRNNENSSIRKTKRCLTDLMNASKDDPDIMSKRFKLDENDDPQLLPAGIKRHHDFMDQFSSPSKRRCEEPTSSDWHYINPQPGTSFLTPTKNYERRNCRKISPKSPSPSSKFLSPDSILQRTPVKGTPQKVQMITFNTPTKNLPNFVLNGEAPHLRLMSPAKKRQDTPNWLTLIVREKKGKGQDIIEKSNISPLSPRENIPMRRSSTNEKTPKSIKKSRTLLKYFNITNKK